MPTDASLRAGDGGHSPPYNNALLSPAECIRRCVLTLRRRVRGQSPWASG